MVRETLCCDDRVPFWRVRGTLGVEKEELAVLMSPVERVLSESGSYKRSFHCPSPCPCRYPTISDSNFGF